VIDDDQLFTIWLYNHVHYLIITNTVILICADHLSQGNGNINDKDL